MHLSADRARRALADSGALFVELFRHGTLAIELYRPVGEDLQQPHTRDEAYVVLSGHGHFECQGETVAFQAGDFLFVPAYAPHRFVQFSDDFATWVLFYGPEGGEAPNRAG